MTTASAYKTIRVPVTTPIVKAILAVTFARTISREMESLAHAAPDQDPIGELWAGTEALSVEGRADDLVESYMAQALNLHYVDGLLRRLHDVTPAPDAVIDVAGRYGLLEQLDKTVEGLTEDVSRQGPDIQRRIAEATIAAIDLQETVAALQDATSEGGA
jgi:hypothetical protein